MARTFPRAISQFPEGNGEGGPTQTIGIWVWQNEPYDTKRENDQSSKRYDHTAGIYIRAWLLYLTRSAKYAQGKVKMNANLFANTYADDTPLYVDILTLSMDDTHALNFNQGRDKVSIFLNLEQLEALRNTIAVYIHDLAQAVSDKEAERYSEAMFDLAQAGE